MREWTVEFDRVQTVEVTVFANSKKEAVKKALKKPYGYIRTDEWQRKPSRIKEEEE